MLLREIIIENYPDRVLLAKKRRTKYYTQQTTKKLPKKYQTPEYQYNVKGILINTRTGVPAIINPNVAGTPRWLIINFQDIWNGKIKEAYRAKMSEELKILLRPHLNIEPIHPSNFPLSLSICLYNTEMKIDVSNKGVIFIKTIEDLLQELNIIPNDNSTVINDTGRCKFIKIREGEIPKMVIKIWKSNNEEI